VLPEQQGDVQRLHVDARVTPLAVPVRPGHGAVRAIAESGTPVPAPSPVRRAARPERRDGAKRYPGRRGRPVVRRKPAA